MNLGAIIHLRPAYKEPLLFLFSNFPPRFADDPPMQAPLRILPRKISACFVRTQGHGVEFEQQQQHTLAKMEKERAKRTRGAVSQR